MPDHETEPSLKLVIKVPQLTEERTLVVGDIAISLDPQITQHVNEVITGPDIAAIDEALVKVDGIIDYSNQRIEEIPADAQLYASDSRIGAWVLGGLIEVFGVAGSLLYYNEFKDVRPTLTGIAVATLGAMGMDSLGRKHAKQAMARVESEVAKHRELKTSYDELRSKLEARRTFMMVNSELE